MGKYNIQRMLFPDSPDIKNDLNRRFSHMINAPGKVEFKLPEENYINRLLFHNVPTGNVNNDGRITKDGTFGHIKWFYIPPDKHNSLTKAFEKARIPKDLYNDLIGVYLNMFFSKCTLNYTTQFERNFKATQNGLVTAMDFLFLLAQDKFNITEITLEYQDIITDEKDISKSHFGEKKKLKLNDTFGVGLLEEALKKFEAIDKYDIFNSFYQAHKNAPEPINSSLGYKNEEKRSQSYYCSVIYDYLRQSLFSPLFQLLGQPALYEKEVKLMKRKYSHRRIFLLIGELMLLSGLLSMKEDVIDEEIIENIKKKLASKIKFGQEKIKQMKERNKKSTDGTAEIIPFHELF